MIFTIFLYKTYGYIGWNDLSTVNLTTQSRERDNMVVGPVGFGTEYDCTGEDQQHIT
jgi:hypothetical protein